MCYILIYHIFLFPEFQIIQRSLIIFFNMRVLAVKLVLRFVTSEFSGDCVLKLILTGSSRLSNRIFL